MSTTAGTRALLTGLRVHTDLRCRNYIAVFYSSTQQTYKLWTYRSATSTNPNPGQPIAEEYDPAHDGRPNGYGFEGDAAKGWVAVSLDSPRLGSWMDPQQRTARSLDGQLAVFRVWTAEQGGADTCPCTHASTLEAYYVFGESSSTLRDISGSCPVTPGSGAATGAGKRYGSCHDGTIHGAKFGEDEPLSECVQELRGMAKEQKLTENCIEDGIGNGVYFLVAVLLLGVAGGGWKFWQSRPPGTGGGGGGGGKGLSSSLLEMGAVRNSVRRPFVQLALAQNAPLTFLFVWQGASAPAAPAAAASSSGGGGTIYD